jgi:xanthine/CO dehydrogenase XdhC/CoxF family maturation factor
MNSANELITLIDTLRMMHRNASSKATSVTLTRTHGSIFRRFGTRMLVFDDGRVLFELSGGQEMLTGTIIGSAASTNARRTTTLRLRSPIAHRGT